MPATVKLLTGEEINVTQSAAEVGRRMRRRIEAAPVIELTEGLDEKPVWVGAQHIVWVRDALDEEPRIR